MSVYKFQRPRMQSLKLNGCHVRNLCRIAYCCGLSRCCLALLLIVLPAGAQTVSTVVARVPQTFVFKAASKLHSVAVAGTFNNWSKTANPLIVAADGLTWRGTVPLAQGKYLYKLVLDNENWIVDPNAAHQETDAGGNTNSVLLLTPSDYNIPASPNDGVTATSALLHNLSAPYSNYDRGKLTLSLRARPNDLRRVWLRATNRRYPLQLVSSDDLYALYRGDIAWDRKANLTYSFELLDGDRVEQFGANGLKAPAQPFHISAKDFQPFAVPSWVERTVFYQIFPDRFANGDKTNDPPDVAPWDANPTGFNRFGGDVAGVRQHLPYLADLGISGVYFNPVFKSPVIHRYETEDYKQIDPQFGTNSDFAALTQQMRQKGIRTVLDFVLNHTATTFVPFADIRQQGAASPYKDWYFIKSYPVKVADPPNYVAWMNYPSMPKLNVLNPATSDYLLGVAAFWQNTLPLAGLRLDAANEVDMRFWRKLRERVKRRDPQAWILGEEWNNGSPWLGGDQWDAVMNYPFLFANADFFADGKTSAAQFTARLIEVYNWYPPQVSRNLMNLLSSHDTPRFLTRCHNDARLAQLAAAVQFTWVGAPSIYYGEEIGMEGGADPDNRRPMRWDKATPDNAMLRYYKRLIQLRHASRALQSGDPSILLADDKAKTLAYARTLDNDIAIVALNRSDSPQTLTIPLPQNSMPQAVRKAGLRDALSGQRLVLSTAHSLSITLPPLRAAILLPVTQ